MEVWIVSGRTGSYEDVSDWNVGWYRTEKAAKAAVVFLNELSFQAAQLPRGSPYDTTKATKFMQQFDPNFSVDNGTGTEYVHYLVATGPDFTNKKLTKDQLEMLVSLVEEEVGEED